MIKSDEEERKRSASNASSIADDLDEHSDLEHDGFFVKDAKVVFDEILEHSELKESEVIVNLDDDLIEFMQLDSDIEVLFGKEEISAMCASKNSLVSFSCKLATK
jgi:competence protein ComGF